MSGSDAAGIVCLFFPAWVVDVFICFDGRHEGRTRHTIGHLAFLRCVEIFTRNTWICHLLFLRCTGRYLENTWILHGSTGNLASLRSDSSVEWFQNLLELIVTSHSSGVWRYRGNTWLIPGTTGYLALFRCVAVLRRPRNAWNSPRGRKKWIFV